MKNSLDKRIRRLEKKRNKQKFGLMKTSIRTLAQSKKLFIKPERSAPVRLEKHERLNRTPLHIENEDQIARIMSDIELV